VGEGILGEKPCYVIRLRKADIFKCVTLSLQKIDRFLICNI